MKRLLMAFALAPLVGVVVSDLYVCAALGCGEPGGYWGPPSIYVFVGSLVGYPLVLLVGPPVFWLLWQKKWLAGWLFVLLGVLLGAIGAAVTLWPFHGPSFESALVRFGIFGLVAGLCGGAAFWAIGVRSNRALTASSRGDAPPAVRS